MSAQIAILEVEGHSMAKEMLGDGYIPVCSGFTRYKVAEFSTMTGQPIGKPTDVFVIGAFYLSGASWNAHAPMKRDHKGKISLGDFSVPEGGAFDPALKPMLEFAMATAAKHFRYGDAQDEVQRCYREKFEADIFEID